VLRIVLPPLITTYAIFVAMVALALRRPAPRPRGFGRASPGVRWREAVETILGGYAAFLLVVLVFHTWIADEPAALANAIWGGAFLCGVTLALAAGSALAERRRRAAR
jgi:hypothetical protein